MLKVKEIKQMQIKDIDDAVKGVDDMVLLSPTALGAVAENEIRLALRKKDIRLRLVKNTFMRRIFDQRGIKVDGCWDGPTMLAWGGSSLAGLSKELESSFKSFPKVTFKTAVAEGEQVTFEQALKMPTKEEAVGIILMLVSSPGRRLMGQLRAPAARIAGQLKALSEKETEEKTE